MNELNKRYALAASQARSLIDPQYPAVTNYANLAAFLNELIPDINWVGFYFLDEEKLYLGPFAGKPACAILLYGKGVCWKAVLDNDTVYVPDVHVFPGHIACDGASASELVIPLFAEEKLIGVLDIDSPLTGRFSPSEISWLKQIADVIHIPM